MANFVPPLFEYKHLRVQRIMRSRGLTVCVVAREWSSQGRRNIGFGKTCAQGPGRSGVHRAKSQNKHEPSHTPPANCAYHFIGGTQLGVSKSRLQLYCLVSLSVYSG